MLFYSVHFYKAIHQAWNDLNWIVMRLRVKRIYLHHFFLRSTRLRLSHCTLFGIISMIEMMNHN